MAYRRVIISTVFLSKIAALCIMVALSGCLGEIGRRGTDGAGALEAEAVVFPEEIAAGSISEDAFQITEYAPDGTVPWQNVEGGIWVLFNEPVIPAGKLGKPIKESEHLQIYPPVDGIFRWYGSRLLSFEPTTTLVPATEYTVVVDSELRSLAGRPR